MEKSKVKTESDRKIVDCQAIASLLNKFNAHKILWGRYCSFSYFIDEKSKARDVRELAQDHR